MLLSKPELVLATLRQIQQDHPYAEDGQVVESPRAKADADSLWRHLLSLDPDALDSTLSGLTTLQERIALWGARTRLDSSRCLEVLARLFSLRSPESGGSVAWDAWLLSSIDSFRGAASVYVEEHSDRAIWPRLLRAASPLKEAVRILEEGELPFDEWAALPATGLADRPLVVSRLRRMLLDRKHLVATSKREPHRAIRHWVNAHVVPEKRESWYHDFLCSTYQSKWPQESAVLESIVGRFGRPDSGRPFWSAIPAEVQREVNAWVNGGKISQLLQGRRAEFWLRFRYDITRLEESRCRGAVFVGFNSWFAVQYKDMGRATYMFLNDQWVSLRWKAEPTLYSTEILGRYRAGRYLGRYEHRADDWEFGAQREVMRVMKLQGSGAI